MRLWDKSKTDAPLRGAVRSFLAVLLASCLWLPCLHLFFRRDLFRYRSRTGLSEVATRLAATHLAVWSQPDLRERELAKMRGRNPEWDFMSRTYFVLALANMALRDPAYRQNACTIIDTIIDNTIEVERESGFEHFLLTYGHTGGWVADPPGSLFVDGEIALMLGARRFVEEKKPYQALLADRIAAVVRRMSDGPVLCGESYPDECWLFCNTVALAAIRMQDALDGTDHSGFISSWVETAKRRLTDPRTGLLISAFSVDGTPAPCGSSPEGSTIWMATHMLEVVDADWARDQFRRAKMELGRSILGFGYSREWPVGVAGSMDVDSGPVLPVVGASASASGLAILAAAAFEDSAYLRQLLTSLEAAGFPVESAGRRRYLASNQVGDAVLLYALTQGPLWSAVRRKRMPSP